VTGIQLDEEEKEVKVGGLYEMRRRRCSSENRRKPCRVECGSEAAEFVHAAASVVMQISIERHTFADQFLNLCTLESLGTL
jgi:hypothetical protein